MRETPNAIAPLVVRGQTFAWGRRTYLMGIINVTPDSFSGDGLLGRDRPGDAASAVATAVALARRMVAEGADILDVGGESTRPGHDPLGADEEAARVVAVVAAVRGALPDVPVSIDTTKPSVAAASLDAGADIVNDVAATSAAPDLAALVARRGVPYVLSHAWPEPRTGDIVEAVCADLARAVERAVALGCTREALIVDPGFGFGKTPEQNLALLRHLGRMRTLGRPVLLGASRKSTLGLVLGLPPAERLEATLATTALGIAAGADIVRVHDVSPNFRVARMSDAVVRGWGPGAADAPSQAR